MNSPTRQSQVKSVKLAPSDMEANQSVITISAKLLGICTKSNWKPVHLRSVVKSKKALTILVAKELELCCEKKRYKLALKLCNAALANKLSSPSLTQLHKKLLVASDGKPKRERPNSKILRRHSSSRQSTLEDRSVSAEPRPKQLLKPIGLLNQLARNVAARCNISPSQTLPPDPTIPIHSDHYPKNRQQLVLLRLISICERDKWTPKHLNSSSSDDLGLLCAQEMQLCRQKGRHSLVISLAAEAALNRIYHPRIDENLRRSMTLGARELTIKQINACQQNDSYDPTTLINLICNALIADPDCKEYREKLRQIVGKEVNGSLLADLSPDLIDATIDLRVNQYIIQSHSSLRGL